MKAIFTTVILFAIFGFLQAQTNDSLNNRDTVRNLICVFDVGPQFPGGYDSLNTFIRDNFNYPKEARENNTQGTVYIVVTVETDGSLSSIKVIRGIGYGCDEEAIRLFEIMPPWIPAKDINGNPIRNTINIPVRFILQG